MQPAIAEGGAMLLVMMHASFETSGLSPQC